MPVRVLILAVALAGGAVVAAAAPQRPAPRFDDIWAAYQTGDHQAIGRAIVSPADYNRIRGDLLAALRRWRVEWQPMHALFMFDVVKLTVERHWWRGRGPELTTAQGILAAARQFVVSRPQKIGEHAAFDAFEVHWHRAVLALFQSRLIAFAAEDYLEALGRRVAVQPAAADREPVQLVDPRLALSAALIRESWTTPDTIASLQRRPEATLAIENPGGAVKKAVEDTLERFDLALAIPDTAPEAAVRKSFLLFRLGRHADALALVDAHPAPASDPTLVYWRALVRARILHALNRLSDAIAAHEAAHRAAPEAQSPMVALAALHFLDNRRAEALQWIDALRQAPADAADPWLEYWFADGRFLHPLIAKMFRVAAAR